MPYSPPDFSALLRASEDLENHFSAIANRYKSSNLEALLQAVTQEICDTQKYKAKSFKRQEQADVFRLLSNELARITNAEQKNEALQCMLGALIHRFFRIETEYKHRIDSKLISFIGQVNPESCGLYQAIKRVLNVCRENPLDPLTIVSCCQSFYDNMRKDNRYQKFPHFKEDPQFFSNLQRIIDKYRPAAEPVLIQIHAIKFLQSLARQMKKISDKTDAECQLLIRHLQKYYPDLSQLDLDTVIKILPDKIKDEGSRQRIQLLLSLNYIVKNVADWNYEQFEMRLHQCVVARSQYALFGAYMLVFEDKPHEEMQHFKDVTHLALNPDGDTIPVDVKLKGIRALEDWFLDINENHALDCTTWAGKYEVFEKRVTAYKSNLLKTLVEQQQPSEQGSAASLNL